MLPRPSEPEIPGLARLLADLPRERLLALATTWQIDPPDQPGVIAALYRRLTDPIALGQEVGRLPEVEAFLFDRLRAKEQPVTRSELLRVLPFAEETLAQALASLDRRGLIWLVQGAPGARAAGEARWTVARDVRLALNAKPPVARAGQPRATAPADGELRPSTRRPSRIAESGMVLHLVEGFWKLPPGITAGMPPFTPVRGRRIGGIPPTSPPGGAMASRGSPPGASFLDSCDEPRLRAYAWRCAVGLGVLVCSEGCVVPGPRSDAWQRLGASGQVRALARFWLVDDEAPLLVPAHVRQGLWKVLRRTEVATWYDLDVIARWVARGVAPSPTARLTADREVAPSHSGLARRDLVRGLELLSGFGVVELGLDPAGRPILVRVTGPGREALT